MRGTAPSMRCGMFSAGGGAMPLELILLARKKSVVRDGWAAKKTRGDVAKNTWRSVQRIPKYGRCIDGISMARTAAECQTRLNSLQSPTTPATKTYVNSAPLPTDHCLLPTDTQHLRQIRPRQAAPPPKSPPYKRVRGAHRRAKIGDTSQLAPLQPLPTPANPQKTAAVPPPRRWRSLCLAPRPTTPTRARA